MKSGKCSIAIVGCGRIARNHVASYQKVRDLMLN